MSNLCSEKCHFAGKSIGDQPASFAFFSIRYFFPVLGTLAAGGPAMLCKKLLKNSEKTVMTPNLLLSLPRVFLSFFRPGFFDHQRGRKCSSGCSVIVKSVSLRPGPFKHDLGAFDSNFSTEKMLRRGVCVALQRRC